ncbi:uncharacterized protein LOC133188516 isoform X2 [Saccostrea echinata]|uniref:uncharacterized protein LOC133188516 isoform X2 n=1 Tax=Saccostrea echinata TaxID=191078 RepID=UPI002A80459F|nr:uncharacterized protein LOC133188516 isoform X2 [Saccostrea echinata]
MEYRGMGRFPGQISRFRYNRPGPPRTRPPRPLLSTPVRARFEPPRAIRPRTMTPSPRGNIQVPFRGFKATPMIPVRPQHGQMSDYKTGTKNDTGKDYVSPNYREPENTGSVSSKQIDKDTKESDMANTDSSLKEDSANHADEDTLKSAETEITSEKQEPEKLGSAQTSNQSAIYEKTSQDSTYDETANQEPYFEASTNENLNTDETSNQNSYFDKTANQDSYFEETTNQDSYSEEASYQDSFQDQGSNFNTYQDDKEETDAGQGDNKAEGGEQGKEQEEEEEEESDEEDTGFCQYCNMPFDNDDAYWKHTRGLLHTQKVMEAENAKKKGQEPDKEPENKDNILTRPSFGTTMMENKASAKDLKYLRQAGFSPHRGRGRGSNRGGYQSPAKDTNRGQTELGYIRGQGQYDRGTQGRGRGQGHNNHGKSFSDGTYKSGFGQRIKKEEEAEEYYGYEEGDQYQEYQEYGDQGENYEGAGDYDDGDFNNEEEGQQEEEYNFYSSNWMDIDKPPEKIPVRERDYYPDTLGKPKFPSDFYCKDCDVKCTSQKNFEMHVEGTKHKMKTLLGKGDTALAKEEEKKKMVVECTSRPSKVDHLINKSDQPIVGLNFVTEFRKPDPSVRPTYVCNLCESKCDMNTVLSHVTGFRHRSNYFKECHPEIYNHMTSNTAKKKSEQNASAEEFAVDCMKQDGQGKIRVKLEIDSVTEAVAANLLSQSGIKMKTFISDLKNKPDPTPIPEKKQRINPVLPRQDQSERVYNKRASDTQYNYTSKHPRGPGNRDIYGETVGPKQVFDYNHKVTQRGYSGSEDQFNPYQETSMGHQTGYPPGDPQQNLPQGDTDDEDKELFREFLEWKRQQKKKDSQSSLQGEGSSSVQQMTEKKAPDQASASDASGSSAADMMFALSQTMIKTEEDAAMALQVSNALTQALLQYRLKNVELPNELTSSLTSGAGQTNPVQTSSAESKKSHISSKSSSSKSSSRTLPQAAPTIPVVSSASASYPQGASLSIPGVSGMTSNVAYTSNAPTGVPPVLDPLLKHMNPMDTNYPTNPVVTKQYKGTIPTTQYPRTLATTQYPGTVSTTQYKGTLATTQYPGTVSTTQYPETIPTTQYAGTLATTQYPGIVSTTPYPETIPTTLYPGTVSTTQYQGYSFYGGQYQPSVPEGYQWGYNATPPEDVPPPPPPREDLPKPPPENQTY